MWRKLKNITLRLGNERFGENVLSALGNGVYCNGTLIVDYKLTTMGGAVFKFDVHLDGRKKPIELLKPSCRIIENVDGSYIMSDTVCHMFFDKVTYIENYDGVEYRILCHDFMSAGENTLGLLEDLGYVEPWDKNPAHYVFTNKVNEI